MTKSQNPTRARQSRLEDIICTMRKPILPSALLLLTSVAHAQPIGTPVEFGLAGYAKVLCSAVFVSFRDPAEAFRNSGYWMMPNDQQDGITYVVDRQEKLVRITRDGVTRTAKFYGDQGCIIQTP